MRAFFLTFFLIVGISVVGFAQAPLSERKAEESNSPKVYKHSPKTATWLSVVLPGAGQVYNRKNWWWKVPVIYAAGGGMLYGIVFYQDNYNAFREAYKTRIVNKVDYNNIARFDKFQTPTLKAIRDSYRQARDQCILGLAAVYALQIMDAAVEAHLLEFNVTDDLSLNVQPLYVPYDKYAYAGIQLNLTFK